MKRTWLISFAFSIGAAAGAYLEPRQVSYDGYEVVRMSVGSGVPRVVEIIEKLALDSWQEPHKARDFAEIVVPPEKINAFHLEIAGMDAVVMHEDLGASISAERQPADGVVFTRSDADINRTWFQSYHQYLDHVSFLEDLVAKYPNNSEIITSGLSYQGNDISAIHIYGSSGRGVRPAVVFHGTVHAREWITTLVVEYFAERLLANHNSDAEIKAFVDNYDFYLYPVVNPDGFIYTHYDRQWRKNRQPNANSTCIGRDINRNWPYNWNTPNGSSTDPCDRAFRGATAGDAPETQALVKALHEIHRQQGLKLYIDWHSFSQVFMTPYGYNCSYLAENNDEMQLIASGAAKAMTSLYGTPYRSGSICQVMYQASGNGIDYVTDIVGGDYSFAVELRDSGYYGFVLPPEQIIPTSREAFEGVKYLLRNMR
ncbi:hypothetical protein VMCG_10366 [Cytospora schulzeri]|uniref:Carboxypeptidase M14A n=1 Tax=Cytospora schulzeri TaxID=448051 RepID=A0A423VCL2_9PEZI|nr:hypothetical protein VMCG_10366 [Valsa malicola]